jgi:type VI secretion system protein ImpF
MEKWSSQDQLQPSLLDRLTDLDPEKTKESASQQVLSQKQYKEAVIRDLGWLLNCVSLDCVVDLGPYPQVARSVLNYGLPDLSGRTSSSIEVTDLERDLQRVIDRFEPRLIPNSLRVRVRSSPHEMGKNALVFEIEGVVFEQPMPFQVLLRSKLDLESGEFDVREERS